MEKLHVDIKALESMHRFGDILEEAILGIQSEIAEFQVIRDAGDCIGPHWYGLRCRVTCRRSGTGLYLHIGLIYYPATRHGLMIELDEQNNRNTYGWVVEQIKESPEFEISREEQEYFKLFLPDAVFEDMSGKMRKEQTAILGKFVKSGAEAMVEAAYQTGFTLNIQNLKDSLGLVKAFEKTLLEAESEICDAAINVQDKDNFGQYAQGFRYTLTNQKQMSLYAYFGAIYSYKKQPAGIFAEIDRFSNKKEYDRVFNHFKPSGEYETATGEEGFLKLFLPREKIEQLNAAEYEEQTEILKRFLKACNEAMAQAWEQGGEQ